MERRSFLKAMAVAFPFFTRRAWSAPPTPELIRTGWPVFDEALGGGFRRNCYVVLKHDASVNENWFLWNLQWHNGREAADIWQFEPDPTICYTLQDGTKLPCVAAQASRWYRINYPKVAESGQVIISPHELKERIVSTRYGQPEVSGAGGHACDYYGSVVIRARATDELGLVEYTITKNRHGAGYPSILVRHTNTGWLGLGHRQIKVLRA